MTAARDAIAEIVASRLKARMPGDYDVGVRVSRRSVGLLVTARVDDASVEHVVWPNRLSRDVDHLVDRLVSASVSARR